MRGIGNVRSCGCATRSEPGGMGAFLKARRAQLGPGEAGLPDKGESRRVPGLRREEVAQLAAISTDYYTRLEQGRVQASAAVLDVLAQVLRFDGDQREYLLTLAGKTASATVGRSVRQRVQPQMRHLLDDLSLTAGFVIGRNTDLLAWNAMAAALVMDFGRVPEEQRNYVRLVFTEPAIRVLYRDWEDMARLALSHLRMDSRRNPDDSRLNCPRRGAFRAGSAVPAVVDLARCRRAGRRHEVAPASRGRRPGPRAVNVHVRRGSRAATRRVDRGAREARRTRLCALWRPRSRGRRREWTAPRDSVRRAGTAGLGPARRVRCRTGGAGFMIASARGFLWFITEGSGKDAGRWPSSATATWSLPPVTRPRRSPRCARRPVGRRPAVVAAEQHAVRIDELQQRRDLAWEGGARHVVVQAAQLLHRVQGGRLLRGQEQSHELVDAVSQDGHRAAAVRDDHLDVRDDVSGRPPSPCP